MASGTFELQFQCARTGCRHGVRVVVVAAVGQRPVSLLTALEAAALTLGMRRVNLIGGKAQVLCVDHTGPIECRRCRFRCDSPSACGCMGGAQFDVDRLTEATP